ncbi:TetR/AcrR family transcriptional regulator [Natronorubrum sp. FCH18a]|uniref:TetR/AcrR family transcriptional regulator n=1 Tax=Natronorubrum sp. FCH18a TaxID=3447018 RepID=UPI003F50FBCA
MRKFSEEERDRIREQLIQTGRELLLTYGPAKTTVKDITEPVGIAKPTFYQFFDAKSDLYIEIFEREFDEYVETMQSELEGVEDPRERLERFFRCYAEFGEENEFIQQVFLRGDYRDVIGNLSSEQIAEMERKEMEALIPPIEDVQAQSEGPIAEMDPVTVLGIMGSSLGLLVLHKDDYDEYENVFDEIDGGVYDHVQEALIATLARGLTVAD